MWTRKDYLDKKCSHKEYYDQFVNVEILSYIKAALGDRIRKSTDPHFNDIPIGTWDCRVETIHLLVSKDLIRETGQGWSLSSGVSIAKAAARRIRDDS